MEDDSVVGAERAGEEQDGEHVRPVGLERRSRLAAVPLASRASPARGIEAGRHAREELVPRRIDQVEPAHGLSSERNARIGLTAPATAPDKRCGAARSASAPRRAQPRSRNLQPSRLRHIAVWTPPSKTPSMFVAVDLPRVTRYPVPGSWSSVEEERGVRVVADRDEQAVRLEHALLSVIVSSSRTATTEGSPSTSTTTLFSTNSIFSFARARSAAMGDARNSSRRWTRYTLLAKRG